MGCRIRPGLSSLPLWGGVPICEPLPPRRSGGDDRGSVGFWKRAVSGRGPRSRFLVPLAAAAAATFVSVLPAAPAQAQTNGVTGLYYRISPAGTVNPTTANFVRTLKLSWTQPTSPLGTIFVYGVKRAPDNTSIGADSEDPTNEPLTVYDHTWASGTTYTYYLWGILRHQVYNPNTGQYDTVDDPWTSTLAVVTPYDLAVTDNATADARMDLRFSSVVNQNYRFNDPASKVYMYRGGLYAGYNADGSQAARTFLKFPLQGTNDPATGKLYPYGGLYLFKTRNTKTGSVSLVVYPGASTNWTQPDLVWSNAPATSGSAGPAVSVSWDSAAPASAWAVLNPLPAVESILLNAPGPTTSGTLIVAAQSESSVGFSYFAMKEFTLSGQSGYGARLLYATGGLGATSGGGGGGSTGGSGYGGYTPAGGGQPHP